MGDRRLRLFATCTQLGAAEDMALSEMKIKLMFPADVEAAAFLTGKTG
jgi:hypothetical protein